MTNTPLKVPDASTSSTVSFNQLTPAQAELLALLAEECGESTQIIGKILRHGYESYNPLSEPESRITNRALLEKELGDIQAAMILLQRSGAISESSVQRYAEEKLIKVGQWLHHQGAINATTSGEIK